MRNVKLRALPHMARVLPNLSYIDRNIRLLFKYLVGRQLHMAMMRILCLNMLDYRIFFSRGFFLPSLVTDKNKRSRLLL